VSWSKFIPDGFRQWAHLKVPIISGQVFYVNVKIRGFFRVIRGSVKIG
jgi:hypothetical protein